MLTFKAVPFENITILTLVVTRIDASNSNIVKKEILEFLSTTPPKGLLINLTNIEVITSVGVGALISINSKSKRFDHYALTGIKPQIESVLKASRLDILFQVITPESACLICGEFSCEHLAELAEKLNLYTSEDDLVTDMKAFKNIAPPKESLAQKIVRRLTGQLDPNIVEKAIEDQLYQENEQKRLKKEKKQLIINYGLIFLMSTLFVGGGGSLVWIAVKTGFTKKPASTNSMRRKAFERKVEKLSRVEILERYDRNGDGVFNRDDWLLLQAREKLFLINQGLNFREDFKKEK